jgi:biopolymer transport protein ExbD
MAALRLQWLLPRLVSKHYKKFNDSFTGGIRMAMSMPSGGDDDAQELSNINTTPLVDVMLVLLIIFLITIPVITHTVPVDLPKATNEATKTKPENISIAIDADGKVYWNSGLVASQDQLLTLIKSASQHDPQPEVHIRADKNVRYEYVGRVVVLCQRGGIGKVGFITEPQRRG